MNDNKLKFHYYDPRLQMTHVGRLFIRVVFYATYGIFTASCATFLMSDIPWIFWTGVFLFIVLLDRAKHFGQADWSLRAKVSGDVNLARYVSPASFAILEYAYERALFAGGNFYLFALKKLIERKDIKEGLARMDLNISDVSAKVDELLAQSLEDKKYAAGGPERKRRLILEIEKIASLAYKQAILADGRFIEPKDIFAALSYCDSTAVLRVLQLFNIDAGDLQNALIFSRYKETFGWLKRMPATLGGFVYKPYKVRHRVMNRAWSARPTPILDQYSEDLTDYARLEKVGFLIGHDQEYDRMLDVLSRPTKPNVMLIGDPGAGKETLVNHLAYKITKDEVPAELFDKRLVLLRVGGLMAGSGNVGEIQARVTKIIEEIIQAGNIILYIPDMHNLIKTSGKTGMNAADIFLPAFASSAFSVIGATYPKEYKQTIEQQIDFAKVFENINIQEISAEDAMRLLVYGSIILERQFRIKITSGAIKQAVFLSSKYFRDKLLPSSAEDLLKEALSDAKDKGDKVLNVDDVIDIAQRRVNIPLRQAREQEAEKLLNMEDLIHKRLVDQDEAVKAVSRSLREYRSGLSRKGGPIATFLFVGPTGVGKTELSKILANIQFGSKDSMIRFDMSEYQDKQSIFRFIGSPDGNVSGALTDAVLQNPDILNLFLQVFDDGRLTDNMGRIADFQNTIVIATSNAHSDFIKESLEAGKKMEEISDALKKKLTEFFRPELINRFSGIIVFKSLSKEDTEAIAGILLKDLANDVNSDQGIRLDFSDSAIKKISDWGYDPVFGARPLRGVISDKIRSVLAEKILKGEIVRGGSARIDLEKDNLIFHAD